jgi:putative ABC transport system substrate-binding protein
LATSAQAAVADSHSDQPLESTPGLTAKRVALVRYSDSQLHIDGVAGMRAGLADRGFIEGENLELVIRDAGGDPAAAESIATEVVEGRFDLILTSGTQALQAVAKANESVGIPHVFGVVANPFAAGVGLSEVNPSAGPPHLVGHGSFPPVAPVFELAREMYPGLTVVGVVFNPAESNSLEATTRARSISEEMGIELLEAEVGSVEEVAEAAEGLVAQGAEVLWIGADNTLSLAAESVIATARAANIPVISSLTGHAESGALFELGFDFYEVGKVVGVMAGEILAGTDPADLEATVHPDEFVLILNRGALAGLRDPWSIPDDVAQRATTIHE